MSSKTTFELYAQDLGTLLKQEAIEACSKRDKATPADRPFHKGMCLAYINVLNLMLDQAKAFEIPPSALTLQDFEPDELH